MENISISFNTSIFLIVIGVLLCSAYAYYVYYITIPKVSAIIKYSLIILRASAVVLLLLLIFEPLLTITKKDIIEPSNYVFIDNSNSIAAKDSIIRNEKLRELFRNFLSNKLVNVKVFSFGYNIDELKEDSSNKILLTEPLTNYSDIFDYLKNVKENISSAVIVSDGIVNDGPEPYYSAERSTMPIYTVGIGDTSQYRDVQIKDVLFNQYIYAQKPTEIEIVISNYGFENQKTTVALLDEGVKIDSKEFVLSAAGINKIKFNITPPTAGERKFTVSVNPFSTEENKLNNSKTFLINVLNNKIKITVIAGSPSPDLSTVIQSLEADKNLDVKKIIQISTDKFWKEYNLSLIDSADILFLVDFPKSNTPQNLIDKVFLSVQNNKPFFLQVTPNSDLQKLKDYNKLLPFTIGLINNESFLANPELSPENFSSTLSQTIGRNNIWTSLPPINKTSSEIIVKSGSIILIKSVARNIQINSPILISRNIANQRSIVFLGGDIWRWNLASSEKRPGFFSNFIGDIVKWLNISDEKKQFTVRTNKGLFSSGEEIQFTAELYNQTFSPIDSASIEISISESENKVNLIFEKVKDGIYTAKFSALQKGDYRYEAVAKFNGNSLASNKGRFFVTDSEIEKLETRMNIYLLKQIASLSSGKYYDINDYENLIKELEIINSHSSKEIVSYNEIELWSDKWTLILILLLFSLEWFIRKKNGML